LEEKLSVTNTRVHTRLGLCLGAFLMAFLGVVPNLFAQTPSVQAKAEMAFRKQLNASNQRFMQNKGQWDKKAKFLAQYPGYAVWLTEKGGWRVDQFRKSTD
jgi:hypothetical protein